MPTQHTTQMYSCTIATSDPTTGKIEAVIPGNLENVTVISTPVAFRWPVAGEVWRIKRVNGIFYLDEPYPVIAAGAQASTTTTAANTINTIDAGDVVLNTPTGKVWVMGSDDGSTDFNFSASNFTNGPWVTLIPSSPWIQGTNPLQYMKDAIGFVHLRGNVSKTASGSAPIGTLPPNFRPGITDYYVTLTNGGIAGSYLLISTAGTITGTVPTSGQLWFNSITFLAEN